MRDPSDLPILTALARAMRRALIDAAALMLVLQAVPAVDAGQVRVMSLEDLVQRADRIFSGRCLRTEIVWRAQLGTEVTLVTFEVESAAKGDLGATLGVQILGVPAESRFASTSGIDAPHFVPGERVVLFRENSSLVAIVAGANDLLNGV